MLSTIASEVNTMKARWMRAVYIGLCVLLVAACSSPEQKKAKFLNKGQTLFEKGDLVEARLELKNAIQIDPKVCPGVLHARQGRDGRQRNKKGLRLFCQGSGTGMPICWMRTWPWGIFI